MAIDYSGTDDTYLVDDKLVELGVCWRRTVNPLIDPFLSPDH